MYSNVNIKRISWVCVQDGRCWWLCNARNPGHCWAWVGTGSGDDDGGGGGGGGGGGDGGDGDNSGGVRCKYQCKYYE